MRMLCSVKLSEHRYKTAEGYLYCQDAIIARTGPQTYLKSEIIEGSDSDEYIDVDRKPEEVFSEKTMASFEGKPLTIDHPSSAVTPENYKELSVGFVHNVRKGKYEGQDVLIADITVCDADAIDLIESGEMEQLSCGYDCDIDTDANGNSQQINIRGNHVALCEQGRAGIARILDSKKTKWGVKPITNDSVGKGSLIQEFGKQGKQYKVSKIVGNVIYAEELNSGKTVLFKKDEENTEWAIISKSEVKDSAKKYALVVNGEWYSSYDTYEKAQKARERFYEACEEEEDTQRYYGSSPNIDIVEINDSKTKDSYLPKAAEAFENEIKEFVDKLGPIEDVRFDYCGGYIPREHKAWCILIPYNSEFDKIEEGAYDYSSEDRALDKLKEEFEKAGYKAFIQNNHGHIKVYQKDSKVKDSDDDQFNVFLDNMTEEEARNYCDVYGLTYKPDREGKGMVISGDENNIEEMLKDYIGRYDLIGQIMNNGWNSIKDSKTVKDKNYVICLGASPDTSTWLDMNDRPTADFKKARRFSTYEEADSHRKTYCNGSVSEVFDSRKLRDTAIQSQDVEEVKKSINGINYDKIEFDPEIRVIDIYFSDKKEMKKAGKKLVSLYDLELNEDDDELSISLYNKYSSPKDIQLTEDSKSLHDRVYDFYNELFDKFTKSDGKHYTETELEELQYGYKVYIFDIKGTLDWNQSKAEIRELAKKHDVRIDHFGKEHGWNYTSTPIKETHVIHIKEDEDDEVEDSSSEKSVNIDPKDWYDDKTNKYEKDLIEKYVKKGTYNRKEYEDMVRKMLKEADEHSKEGQEQYDAWYSISYYLGFNEYCEENADDVVKETTNDVKIWPGEHGKSGPSKEYLDKLANLVHRIRHAAEIEWLSHSIIEITNIGICYEEVKDALKEEGYSCEEGSTRRTIWVYAPEEVIKDSKVKDEEKWTGYDLLRGPASKEFKSYLRDRGLYFEPSENGRYVHFEVKNADKYVDQRAEDIRNHWAQHKEVGDKFSRKFYIKSIRALEDELKKLDRKELLDENNEDYENEKNRKRKILQKQIDEYKAILKDE